MHILLGRKCNATWSLSFLLLHFHSLISTSFKAFVATSLNGTWTLQWNKILFGFSFRLFFLRCFHFVPLFAKKKQKFDPNQRVSISILLAVWLVRGLEMCQLEYIMKFSHDIRIINAFLLSQTNRFSSENNEISSFIHCTRSAFFTEKTANHVT